MDAAPLRELLYNRNRPQEQSQAAFSLVQSDSAEVVALVVFEMTRWDRPDVFQSLASAIKLRRDIRYLQPLLDALAAEQAAIRLAAIDALAALPAKTVQEALVKAASDKSLLPLSRQAAVEALGRLATKSAVTSLIELLTCDSANVRKAAVL
ncbi:MAG TPA: HEAT repeat domain-containing protein, partial [Gemmatales bacterium]|nr:HEAT repeat domain-containing protein [Gemmatales bacterium]